ncbi:MAG: hypothetical protein INQ03_08250 [Candidatus Heimdallarchaeota archaeon]|nr:hypothetical protein [Candidatus Heimdallarchaeota archaeon]
MLSIAPSFGQNERGNEFELSYHSIYEMNTDRGSSVQVQTMNIDSRYVFQSFTSDLITVNETHTYDYSSYLSRDELILSPENLTMVLIVSNNSSLDVYLSNTTTIELSSITTIEADTYNIRTTTLEYDLIQMMEEYRDWFDNPVHSMRYYFNPRGARFNILRDGAVNWSVGDIIYLNQFTYTVDEMVTYKGRMAWKLGPNPHSYYSLSGEAVIDKETGILLMWDQYKSDYFDERYYSEINEISFNEFFGEPEIFSSSNVVNTIYPLQLMYIPLYVILASMKRILSVTSRDS